MYQIELAGVNFSTSFTILDTSQVGLILGLDFLRRHMCTVDLHRNRLVFPTERKAVPMCEVSNSQLREA
jgi:hypothetical protein